MQTSKFHLAFLSACLSLIVPAEIACGEMSGEAGRPKRFEGQTRGGTDVGGRCGFTIELERVTFLLNSLENRYKVVRVRVENSSTNAIQLSPENDSIELLTPDNTRVNGWLRLNKQDPALWDSLSKEMRETLSYPSIIPARGTTASIGTDRPEVLYFFTFFPRDKVASMPMEFRYTVQSLPEPIRIFHRGETAK